VAGVGAAEPAGASAGATEVVEALDGATVALADGSRLRLAGIEAPGEGPAAEAARRELGALVAGRRVEAREARADRHGRALAQLVREDGLWVQAELLRRGHARVRTRPEDRDRARALLEAEAEARERRLGLWALAAFRVRDAAGRPGPPDRFHVVEGTVLAAGSARGRVYLNFGPDRRADFTAVVESRDLRAFRAAGLDPAGLAGRRVRVRGWLFERDGPMVELTHPEQVELLP
jgi:endonuclease YncB( thermonuclease family)